jgi:hypothetical protein
MAHISKFLPVVAWIWTLLQCLHTKLYANLSRSLSLTSSRRRYDAAVTTLQLKLTPVLQIYNHLPWELEINKVGSPITELLTPKGPETIFKPFLKAIVKAIFIKNSWIKLWTCGLVLASRRTNFYKIPIFGTHVLKCVFFSQIGQLKNFLLLRFFSWNFFLEHILCWPKF